MPKNVTFRIVFERLTAFCVLRIECGVRSLNLSPTCSLINRCTTMPGTGRTTCNGPTLYDVVT